LDVSSYSLIFEFDQSALPDPLISSDLPILDITYYAPSESHPQGIERNIQIPMLLQYTDCQGKRSNYGFSDSLSHRLVTSKYNVSFAFADRPMVNNHTLIDYDPRATLRYPIKFDFSAVDFFSSVQRPTIKILTSAGSPTISLSQPSKIINWNTFKAILFKPDGQVIQETDKYYGMSVFEHYWGQMFGLGPSNGLPPGISWVDIHAKTMVLKCDPALHQNQCLASLKFSMIGEPSPSNPNTSPTDPTKVNTFKKPYQHDEENVLTSWYSFSAVIDPLIPKTSLFIEGLTTDLGNVARVHWIKIFYPSSSPWIFDILTYHLNSESNVLDKNHYLKLLNTYKHYPLVPFEKSSVAKQLFYYHNYNYNGNYTNYTHYDGSNLNIPPPDFRYYLSIQGGNKDLVFLDPIDGSKHHYYK